MRLVEITRNLMILTPLPILIYIYILTFQFDITNIRNLDNKPYNLYISSGRHNITNISRPIFTRTSYALTLHRDYLLNNVSICSTSKTISLLFWVHTSVRNFAQRENIRSSFALRSRYLPEEVRVIFLVGRAKDFSHNYTKKLQEEHQLYGDIIQGDFIDSYHNLTHKAVMALRWIYENCRNVRYVLKIDDDLVFDTRMFFEKMAKIIKNQYKTMWCNVCPHSMIYREGKWKVEKKEFKGFTFWPFSYCAGFAVLLTSDLLTSLYRAAIASPLLWVDDVYTFGILPSRIEGVKKKSFPHSMRLQEHFKSGLGCLTRQKSKCGMIAIGSKTTQEFQEIWKMMMKKYS